MPSNQQQQPQAAPSRSPLVRELLIAMVIVILSLLLRMAPLGQSLWYDEMVTLGNHVTQPWRDIVSGQYSPNNHILFTLLAKLVTPEYADIADITILFRLPSLIAGSLVPVALAWPLRRCCPKLALGIAIVAALHPWLITISTWGRGYALLLLLCILATNSLPSRRRFLQWPYSLLASAALYTQPLAILLIAAHGVTILLVRRELFATWLRSALLTGLVAFLLYLPFFHGARSYWSKPEQPSGRYTQFILASLRYTHWGGDRGGALPIVVSLIILIGGSLAARNNPHIRPQLLTFLFTAVLGFLVPLVIPLAGEVRAMLWLIPLYCICSVALIGQSLQSPPPLRWLGGVAFAILIGCELLADHWISTVPSQPIRDAFSITNKLVDQGHPLIGIYMGAREGAILYAANHPMYFAYQLEADTSPAAELPSMRIAEAKAGRFQRPIYAVVFFEQFLLRDQPDLWLYLHQNYTPIERLPGRLSSATIYIHNPATTTQP